MLLAAAAAAAAGDQSKEGKEVGNIFRPGRSLAATTDGGTGKRLASFSFLEVTVRPDRWRHVCDGLMWSERGTVSFW